jgi:hypothetical protein
MDHPLTDSILHPVTSTSLYPLKKRLGCKQFATNTDVNKVTTFGLHTFDTDLFCLGAEGVEGDNFDRDKVWCVPSATHDSCVHGREN